MSSSLWTAFVCERKPTPGLRSVNAWQNQHFRICVHCWKQRPTMWPNAFALTGLDLTSATTEQDRSLSVLPPTMTIGYSKAIGLLARSRRCAPMLMQFWNCIPTYPRTATSDALASSSHSRGCFDIQFSILWRSIRFTAQSVWTMTPLAVNYWCDF